MPDTAYRDLTDEEIRTYQQEGAVVVAQCVDPVWVERMTRAIRPAACQPQCVGA